MALSITIAIIIDQQIFTGESGGVVMGYEDLVAMGYEDDTVMGYQE